MNLIRFVQKSKLTNVPKDSSLDRFESASKLPGDVLNELRQRKKLLKNLACSEEIIQFPRTFDLEVSDTLSTSILHLLENGEVSDYDDDEQAD